MDNYDYSQHTVSNVNETETYASYSINFGDLEKSIKSKDIRRIDLDCKFGTLRIYFDSGNLQQKELYVNVNAFCGAVELILPKEWKVLDRVSKSMGGLDFEGKSEYNNDEVGKSLIISGKIRLAGIKIIFK